MSAWPAVKVDPALFAGALVRALTNPDAPEQDNGAQLEALRAEELLLVCGALGGDRTALTAVAEVLEVELGKVLGRASLSPDARADLAQVAREHVLVGYAGRRAALAGYSGRGALRAFLRVSATRACLNELAREKRAQRPRERDDALLEALPTPEIDPEIAHLRSCYGAEFKAAFAEGLATLSPRQRTLLRQHHLDGLQPGELGPLYGVHRTTALRWLESAHEDLVEASRRALARRLQSSTAEADSLIRLLASQLNLSLVRRLASD